MSATRTNVLVAAPRTQLPPDRLLTGLEKVRLSGLEPETYGLKVRCSTD